MCLNKRPPPKKPAPPCFGHLLFRPPIHGRRLNIPAPPPGKLRIPMVVVKMIVRRLRDDDGVGDQNVVDSDVDNNCDQCGEHHDRENHGVVQAPFIMVAIAVAAQWCEGNKNYNTATIARQRTGRSEEKCGGGRKNGEHRSCMQRGGMRSDSCALNDQFPCQKWRYKMRLNNPAPPWLRSRGTALINRPPPPSEKAP